MLNPTREFYNGIFIPEGDRILFQLDLENLPFTCYATGYCHGATSTANGIILAFSFNYTDPKTPSTYNITFHYRDEHDIAKAINLNRSFKKDGIICVRQPGGLHKWVNLNMLHSRVAELLGNTQSPDKDPAPDEIQIQSTELPF